MDGCDFRPKKAEEYSKKPTLFRKLFASGSVEEEAMASLRSEKKADDMREQLRQVITFTRASSPKTWQNSFVWKVRYERNVNRQSMTNRKYRRKVIEYTLATILIAITSGLIIWGFWFIMSVKGVI